MNTPVFCESSQFKATIYTACMGILCINVIISSSTHLELHISLKKLYKTVSVLTEKNRENGQFCRFLKNVNFLLIFLTFNGS